MRTLAILGSTGSIGTQALDVAGRYPDKFSVVALTAHSSAEKLFEQVRAFRPKAAGLVKEPKEIPADLRDCEWFFGPDCSEKVLRAVNPDDALAAIVGVAGLDAVWTALETCERVLLANKEALVTGGALVTEKARRLGKKLLPVDSEHSAIFQCLQAAGGNEVEKIILTASGGPFRTWNRERVYRASIEEALGHPTWRMGAKITVDCASMMNKGLEVIEAHHLFAMPPERIEVVVHPQSVVHSMVQFRDGAVLAQLGAPDMRGAIGYAMGYPERLPYGGRTLDWSQLGQLTFAASDSEAFPCLGLAYAALRAGGTLPVALNGANEAAVAAFLSGKIPFGRIAEVVEEVLRHTAQAPVRSPGDVHAADAAARAAAERMMKGRENV